MFKTGQKVVCIKGSETLTENEVYTIKEIIMNEAGVTLFEVEPITFKHGRLKCTTIMTLKKFNKNNFVITL